jgi:CheY-like chemotaxis protein
MDGLEAARQIRELESRPQRAGRRIPIVALTAHALAEVRENCLAIGMDDFLVKPFDEDQMADTLSRWLPLPRDPSPEPARNFAPAP